MLRNKDLSMLPVYLIKFIYSFTIRSNEVIEKEVGLANGKNVLMRIMPYLTREKLNSGLIISFVDITVITNLNNIIRTVLNSNPSIILAFSAVAGLLLLWRGVRLL
ncbi:MAG: hypothetical protein EOO88_35645, partial [Pedobacter sp.]